MKNPIFLITPPFTQLNTPYPATAYLKGFLNTKKIPSFQADLGIEVLLKIFSKEGLHCLFQFVKNTSNSSHLTSNSCRIIALKDDYINTIDAVILFLQGKNSSLALQICADDFLPKASRFNQTDDLDWAFGTMGVQDKAKHLATLYLEDLSDFIVACVDENFGFSRYAERLGRSANSFDGLYKALNEDFSYIDRVLITILEEKLEIIQPKLLLISVPFPGNLYAAFRCAQFVKKHYPFIKIAMGGGFPNTELRSVSDPRVFEFFDYITLDDGELPVELLIDSVYHSETVSADKEIASVADAMSSADKEIASVADAMSSSGKETASVADAMSSSGKEIASVADAMSSWDKETAGKDKEIAIEDGLNKNIIFKRTFLLLNNKVTYINNATQKDYKQSEVGTPDYSDLLLDKYISVIEIVNPMHKMWSDGRWNKLTMAHGCYWGKCTFCDISLDYIKIYEPIAAQIIVDRIATLVAQTGETGFHFVDEAAPPALMREVALEIIRRKIVITWWTNIRFEKSFTADLCLLLKKSGCIAVSGGLEVASDRLLALIDKGVSVNQVAKVAQNFTQTGIMVHAYLMYGYPTQTVQETIDSLEMVRQMFENGVLQSGFWHQFAMTAHSPVGLNPEKFGVLIEDKMVGTFANNDINFTDKTGIDHDKFSYGLKKSIYNFMHGLCFDYELQDWFDFKIPKTKIAPNYIYNFLSEDSVLTIKESSKIIWTGKKPSVHPFTKSKKGKSWEMIRLTFEDKKESFEVNLNKNEGEWLLKILEKTSIYNQKTATFGYLKQDFETHFEDFELFWQSKPINTLKTFGLLVL